MRFRCWCSLRLIVKPARIGTLMSQIDIAPTVLGLLNFSYETRFMGRDVLKADPSRGRAFISTYQKLGFVKDNKLVVLGPQKYLKAYTFDPETGMPLRPALRSRRSRKRSPISREQTYSIPTARTGSQSRGKSNLTVLPSQSHGRPGVQIEARSLPLLVVQVSGESNHCRIVHAESHAG